MIITHKQFELGGIVFGQHCNIDVEVFEDQGFETTSQDVDVVLSERRAFGVDARIPQPWRWTLYTQHKTFAEAQQAISELEQIWMDPLIRRTPSAVVALRYARDRLVDGDIIDDTRIVFGRPRRWVPDSGTGLTDLGLFRVDADFVRVDDLFYGDAEDAITITAPAATDDGGFTVPFEAPLFTIQPDEPIMNTVQPTGGDVPSPFTAEFEGPITNPVLSGNGWEIRLNLSIPAGDSVTVSTYPWGLRAQRSSGSNVSGYLDASTRLSGLRLSHLGETLDYTGQDASGSSVCRVRWRPAYKTI